MICITCKSEFAWHGHVRWTSDVFAAFGVFVTPDGRLPLASSEVEALGFLLFAGDAACCGFDDGPASSSPALGRDRGSEIILRPFPVFGGIATVCAGGDDFYSGMKTARDSTFK